MITQDNVTQEDIIAYTAGSATRIRIPLQCSKLINRSITLAVASDSPIKASIQVQKSNLTMLYDSGWKNAGGTASYSVADDAIVDNIAIASTYISGGTGEPTLEEIKNYLVFSIRGDSVIQAGLIPTVEKLLDNSVTFLGNLRTSVEIIAHRGLHVNGIPENSLDSYIYAGRCGYMFAETDFCPTLDDELVLMHDSTINRTMQNADGTTISSSIAVNSVTLSELREKYVLQSTIPRMRNPIPTLEEFFTTCKESNIFPIAEIKTDGTTIEHVSKAFEIGCSIMGEGNFGFTSFSNDLLDYARSLSKITPLWYISTSLLGTTNIYTGESREDVNNIWYPSYANLNKDTIKELHKKGIKVASWTVPTDKFDDLVKMGVDHIATDTIGANIGNLCGRIVTSDEDWSDFTTGGTISNEKVALKSGQTLSLNLTNGKCWLGGYYFSIKYKGSISISLPNISKSLSSSSLDRRIFQGLLTKSGMTAVVTATSDSEIYNVECACVRW